MQDQPPSPKPPDAEEFRRRRRGMNWTIMLVLVVLCALFYAITIVKMTKA